jgi:hypothetical protein
MYTDNIDNLNDLLSNFIVYCHNTEYDCLYSDKIKTVIEKLYKKDNSINLINFLVNMNNIDELTTQNTALNSWSIGHFYIEQRDLIEWIVKFSADNKIVFDLTYLTNQLENIKNSQLPLILNIYGLLIDILVIYYNIDVSFLQFIISKFYTDDNTIIETYKILKENSVYLNFKLDLYLNIRSDEEAFNYYLYEITESFDSREKYYHDNKYAIKTFKNLVILNNNIIDKLFSYIIDNSNPEENNVVRISILLDDIIDEYTILYKDYLISDNIKDLNMIIAEYLDIDLLKFVDWYNIIADDANSNNNIINGKEEWKWAQLKYYSIHLKTFYPNNKDNTHLIDYPFIKSYNDKNLKNLDDLKNWERFYRLLLNLEDDRDNYIIYSEKFGIDPHDTFNAIEKMLQLGFDATNGVNSYIKYILNNTQNINFYLETKDKKQTMIAKTIKLFMDFGKLSIGTQGLSKGFGVIVDYQYINDFKNNLTVKKHILDILSLF